jgi:hypothetical protein
LGSFGSGSLQDLVNEISDPSRNKEADKTYAYFSPSATLQETDFFSDSKSKHNFTLLNPYFTNYGLSFLRTTATDEDLAYAVKVELKLRGIEPSKDNRILLVGESENLEEANGDSQFDYVRRLASQIDELDRNINHSSNAHSIRAIGILGSDVYDKLLVAEALHKFPDAVFFTNGMDARLLEPKNNH